MKLVSRADWGARNYRLPNGATLYSGPRRGVKLHYLGTAYSDRTHDRCDDYVRQIQAQHMDGNGWSDIGYSFLVCSHGYVYEGRGLRRRNSANGNTSLNEECYAICLLVGSSGLTRPTDAQLHGARDAIDYCRKEGPAGSWLGGHRDGYNTSCPGDTVYAWAKAGAPRPATATPPAASPAPKPRVKYEPFPGSSFFRSGRRSPIIAAMRKRLIAEGCNRYRSSADPDVWGSGDERSYAAWQRECGYSGTAADGIPGKTSWDRLKVPNV